MICLCEPTVDLVKPPQYRSLTKSLGDDCSRLAVDIDGVILDTFSAWLDYYNAVFCDNKTLNDMYDYDLGEVFGVSKQFIYDVFSLIDDRAVGLIDGDCPGVLDELMAAGYVVDLVTAHIPHVSEGFNNLFEALAGHGVHYHDIKFVDVADTGAKARMAYDYDIMIDDNPYNVLSFIGKALPVLYVQPYTYDFFNEGVVNIGSWAEIKELLL